MTKRANEESITALGIAAVKPISGWAMKPFPSLKLSISHALTAGGVLLPAGIVVLCLIVTASPVSAAGAGRGMNVSSYSPSESVHIRQHDGSVGRSPSGIQGRQSRHRGRRNKVDVQRPKAVHGSPWAFGRGTSLGWEKGIEGNKLQQKATPKGLHASTARQAESLDSRKNQESGMRFDIDREEQTWSGPGSRGRVDEDVTMSSNHRVRALAGVRDNDVSFGVGPEVIVRDNDQVHQNYAKSDQPEVQPGVGMQLQVNF